MATVASTPRVTTIELETESAGPFDVGFRIFDQRLRVYVGDEEVSTADYTLTATFSQGYSDSATITFDTAQADGSVIRIESDMPPARGADYTASDPGLARKLNNELARLWSKTGDIDRDILRRPRVPASYDGDAPTMGAPVPNSFLVGNAAGNGWDHYSTPPSLTDMLYMRVAYDTMTALLADGDTWEAYCAGGASRTVLLGGGRQAGDGGKCEVYIQKSTGSETWANTGYVWVSAGGEIALGTNRGAKITWPEGVMNGVAMGMKSMDWVAAGTDVAQQAESAASVDALFNKMDNIMDDQSGLTLLMPKGEFWVYDAFTVEDANYCTIEGEGVGRTVLNCAYYYEVDGTTPKYDNDSGAQNDNIDTGPLITFSRGTRNTIRRFTLLGNWMRGRGVSMRSGRGVLEDMRAIEMGNHSFNCGNDEDEFGAFDSNLDYQMMRNLESRKCLGVSFSARGVAGLAIENCIAVEGWAEAVTADRCDRAVISGVQAFNVCRTDKAAGYPSADIWTLVGGNGGVGAIAPSENSFMTGVHNCRVDGVQLDEASGDRVKPCIRWRAAEGNARGLVVTGNHFANAGVGVSIDHRWNDDDAALYLCQAFTVSSNTFRNIGTASGQGHVQIDEGATYGAVVGNTADTTFKVFGYVDFDAGNPDGDLEDDAAHLGRTIVISGNAPDAAPTNEALSGTTTTFACPRLHVKRITITMLNCSLASTGDILIRMTDTATVTSGYTSTCKVGTAAATADTNGFHVTMGSAALTFTGRIVLTLQNANTHSWTCEVQGRNSTPEMIHGFGSVSLSGPVTDVKILATASDSYDSGNVRVEFEAG
jgi:hypothetical protein